MKQRCAALMLSFLLILSLSACSPATTSQSFGGTIECKTQLIRAKVAGRITTLLIDEGNKVKRNQLVAHIEDDTLKLLLSQQKHLVKIKTAKIEELENSDFTVADEVLTQARQDKAMAQDAVKLAEIALSNAEIRAYRAGSVSEVYGSVGDDVAVGTAIAKISDLTDLYGYIFVPQNQLNSFSIGKHYTLLPSNVVGTVVQIADSAEFTPKNTQTGDSKDNIVFRVKLQITHSKDLKPGMSFEVKQ
ncbi:MAG: HlyD family efflux transporter periplasmic adaptor subunit [Clostridia bacterium]